MYKKNLLYIIQKVYVFGELKAIYYENKSTESL